MKSRKVFLCSIIIATLIASLTIKSGMADTGTFYPTTTNDDGFITAIGNHFRDTPYLRLKSLTTDIINGLRFRSLNIPQDAKIDNATLFVRTFHTYDPDVFAQSLVTIYGVDENDAYAFNSSGDFTRAYTSNNVVWNVSEVNGNSWHNVSVTNIVQEIISRYGWRPDNSLAFIILADSGLPRREFATIDYNIIYRPKLEIYWDEDPTDTTIEDIQDQATPPYNDTGEWEWEYNDTYKGIDIYTVTGISKWFNFSTFSQFGAAPKESLINDTYFYVTDMYQDTDSYFRRNYDDYYDDSEPIINVKFGLTIVNIPYAIATGYVTVWSVSDNHQPSFDYNKGYAFTIRTTTDTALFYAWSIDASVLKDSLIWSYAISEVDLPQTRYYNLKFNMDTRFVTCETFTDSAMTNSLGTLSDTFTGGPTWGDGSWLTYEYTNSPTEAAGSNTGYSGAHLSIIEDLDEFIFLVYPNGTLVIPDPLPDGTDPEDYIDDLVGVDPEDPETDKYGTALTKNRWKTFVFVIGMVMFLGTPIFAMMARVSTGRWVMVLFISLCGISILWSLIYM